MRTVAVAAGVAALRGALVPTSFAGTGGTGGAGAMASGTYFATLTAVIDGIESAAATEPSGIVVGGVNSGKISFTWVAPVLQGVHTITYNLYIGTVSQTYVQKSTGLTGLSFELDAYTAGSSVVPPTASAQSQAAIYAKGEGGSNQGSSYSGPVYWENRLETAFGSVVGQVQKRPRLGELKRLIRKYGYGDASNAYRGIIGLLSRPGQ